MRCGISVLMRRTPSISKIKIVQHKSRESILPNWNRNASPSSLAILVLGCLSVTLAGCSGGGLPTSGPAASAITKAQTEDQLLPYALVKLDGQIASLLRSNQQTPLGSSLGLQQPPANILFGVGDIVSVTIFESSSGGLFLPAEGGSRAGNFVQLPDQTIDRNGNISVPYAGSIKAAGRSAVEIQRGIQSRLANRAIEPQAVVTLKEQRSAFVTVIGDVNSPARLTLTAGGERLIDTLARAGGPKARGFETQVTVERAGVKRTALLQDIVSDSDSNIFLQPGDMVYVKSEARTFLAFGATGESGQFDFLKERITMAEAIGKSKGLLDERAEPSSIFLYRLETRERAAAGGVDLSHWEGAKTIPIIYSLNLRDPSGFFVASLMPMQPNDVLYIDNAQTVSINKFLSLIFGVTSAASSTATAVRGL